MVGLAAVAFLLVAGMLAAAVGTAGGIASLVSYPALLLAGLDPLSADVVNIVALLACWPGSVLSSRRELVEVRASLRLGVPIAATGAVVGAILLLTTSVTAFSHIVPFLVLAGGPLCCSSPTSPDTARHPEGGATSRRGR